jgi:hypothetical protein
MKTSAKEIFLAFIFLCASSCLFPALAATSSQAKQAAEIKDQPTIQVKESEYNFGEIIEGTPEVEHQFIVTNTGKAVLKIERVQTSCGCTLVRFDPEIPPGGEGKVTMKINLRNFQGYIEKKASIQSNDPRNPEQIIKMVGTIRAIVDVKPSASVLFRGVADELSPSVLTLTGASTPFHISGMETNLKDDIDYTLETVEAGKLYKLKISNKVRNGNYGGFIKLNTDLAQKPDILIRVTGFVEGEISARPQNVLIGKLSAGQPERIGKVVVTSTRNKPFAITRLTYDQNLMSVSISQETTDNQNSYVLDIQPKVAGVPTGSRRQASLKIETNLSADEKAEVVVNILNHSDQPEAQQK